MDGKGGKVRYSAAGNLRVPRPGRVPATLVLVSLALLAPGAPARSATDGEIGLRPLLVVGGIDASGGFSAPRAIAVDRRQGEILLANTGNHRIEVYDLSGNRRGSFVHRVRTPDGDTVDGLPIALAVDSSGHLLVADLLARYVDVLDFRGRSIARLEPEEAGSDAGGPGSIAVTRAGIILVASRGAAGRVHRFAADYSPFGAWGVAGNDTGRIANVRGLAVTRNDHVVVVSATAALAVQTFSLNGRFLGGFGGHEVGPGNFSLPSGVAVGDDDRIWVADELRQIVQVFDPAGSLVGVVGSGGRNPGEFLYPSALAWGGDRLVAVAERVGNRFQLFRIE